MWILFVIAAIVAWLGIDWYRNMDKDDSQDI